MKISKPVKVLVVAGGGLGSILALHQAQGSLQSSNTSSVSSPDVTVTAKARVTGLESAISSLSAQEMAVKEQLSLTASQLAQKQAELTAASNTALAAEAQAAATAAKTTVGGVAEYSKTSSSLSSPIVPAATTKASASTGTGDSSTSGDD